MAMRFATLRCCGDFRHFDQIAYMAIVDCRRGRETLCFSPHFFA